MADNFQNVVKNRKARHEYEIEETYEAGLVLQGSEVKSIREGRVNISEAHCGVRNGEMWLFNAHIAPYHKGSSHTNHNPRRERKLLLHKNEIVTLEQKVDREGYTIVPLQLYFKNGYAKIKIGVARGKKRHDKRRDIKEREQKRRMKQQMRDANRSHRR
jgi:SsrA-binding protein